MFTDLTHRLRSLIRRRSLEQDLDDELGLHLERLVGRYVADGLPHDEAMRRARLEFGGMDQVKEEYRDTLGTRFADDLMRDLRVAVRSLRATPTVTLVATLSLALGIGANTAIFSLVDSLLLRALPVAAPEKLVTAVTGSSRALPPGTRFVSVPVFLAVRSPGPASASRYPDKAARRPRSKGSTSAANSSRRSA
jgi:hypothetical protein